MGSRLKNRNWKVTELIVHQIEASLSPDSKIGYDVKLPTVYGSLRQCDVVITSGEKPRQTITIVEVQDRNERVKINEFGGWLQKLDDVRAQHLICVSRHPFSNSIVEQARGLGNKVRLIQLSSFENVKMPLKFFEMNFTFNLFEVESFTIDEISSEVRLMREHQMKRNLFSDKKCLTRGGGSEIFNLRSLLESSLSKLVLVSSVKSPWNYRCGYEEPIYFLNETGDQHQVSFKGAVEWIIKVHNITPNILSYEQDAHGALAWMVCADHQSKKGHFGIKIPITIKSDGNFLVHTGKTMFELPLGIAELNLEVTKK